MNRYIAGAIGGLLATVPMTAVMTTLFRKLQPSQQYPLPPREITEVVVDRITHREIGDRPLTYLSLIAHFAYGAATGALYPLFCRRLPQPIDDGATFGVAIWTASYLGWLPTAHILRPATQHPPARNALMWLPIWFGARALSLSARLSRAVNVCVEALVVSDIIVVGAGPRADLISPIWQAYRCTHDRT